MNLKIIAGIILIIIGTLFPFIAYWLYCYLLPTSCSPNGLQGASITFGVIGTIACLICGGNILGDN